jgi:hypothetical protein
MYLYTRDAMMGHVIVSSAARPKSLPVIMMFDLTLRVTGRLDGLGLSFVVTVMACHISVATVT